MKRSIGLVLVCAFSTFAYWENLTTAIKCPRIAMVNSKGGEKLFAQIAANSPAYFSIKARTATRWTVSSDSAGEIRIYRTIGKRDTALVCQKISKGNAEVRLFCEPCQYRVVSTVPIRARFYAWRNLPLEPLAPVGGGFPVFLKGKDNSETPYYSITRDTTAVLKVQGPAMAYVYVRGYVPVTSQRANLELEILNQKSSVAHKLIQITPSAEAAFSKPVVGFVPSKSSLIKIKVPPGIHHYTIKTLSERAVLKFYSKEESAYAARRTRTPVLGAAQPSSTPQIQLASATESREPLLDPLPPQGLTLTAQSGLFYNNNVFTFGEDKIDGFPPDSGTRYRYPSVNNISDVYYPLAFRARYSLGSMRLGAGLSGDVFWSNEELNGFNYSFALGWQGPAYVEFGYTFTPENAIRPTYAGPRRYEMLAYSSNRAEMLMSIRNKWHPEMAFSYALYDYTAPFDYLNAVLFEAEFGIERRKVFGAIDDRMLTWNGSLGVGDILAVKETQMDRSNKYYFAKTGANYDIRSWTFALYATMRHRFYTTDSTSDDNKGRIDFEYGLTPLIQYHAGPLTATLHFFDIDGRNVAASDPDDETSKSYISRGGGIRLSYNAKPLSWMRAE